MNRRYVLLAFLSGALLALFTPVLAQKALTRDYRYAIRLNTLALLNLSGVGELEYEVSKRIGVFAGGGVGVETVNPFGLLLYPHTENQYCKVSGASVYTGVRVGIPIGKFVGLSLKTMVVYGHAKAAGFGCFSSIDSPPIPDPSIGNWFGGYVCGAYAQTFAKRFFVEPVVGMGPLYLWRPTELSLNSFELGGAVQLNVGFRF